MKVHELIEVLSKLDPNATVNLMDSEYGPEELTHVEEVKEGHLWSPQFNGQIILQ